MGFQLHDISLDTANAKTIPRSGHALLIRRVSDATAVINAEFVGGASHGQSVPLIIGEGWRFVAYKNILLSWEAQPGVTIQLIVWGDQERAEGNEPEWYVSPLPVV